MCGPGVCEGALSTTNTTTNGKRRRNATQSAESESESKSKSCTPSSKYVLDSVKVNGRHCTSRLVVVEVEHLKFQVAKVGRDRARKFVDGKVERVKLRKRGKPGREMTREPKLAFECDAPQ